MVIPKPVLLQTISKYFFLVCWIIIYSAFGIVWLNASLWSSKVVRVSSVSPLILLAICMWGNFEFDRTQLFLLLG